jgi:primosomal protein N' (replication factor Y)
MKIIDIIPVTKIPLTQPQILSYFSIARLPVGALVEIPLGRRREIGVVFDSHRAADLKMEIKKAGYELRPIAKIISDQPILTGQQIKLALWLGQYYFCAPGIFLKMMMPPKWQIANGKSQMAKSKVKSQKLTLAPTVAQVENLANKNQKAVTWHSGLAKKQLNEIWWKIKNGQAQTIIGTRSAIFLPFQNLKEVIIEEETDPAHRSWDMFPHYRVHEVVQKLSEIFGAKLILKSEIPSVESFYFSPSPERFAISDKLYAIVDMRSEIKSGNFSIFSRELQKVIANALAQKKQIILFMNRRGASNFVLCRDCGYIARCRNCDTPLSHHLINDKPMLLCHRCGYKDTPPDLCPPCQSHRIKTVGVGTQKVELDAKKLFPQAKISRLDSDAAQTSESQQNIVKGFIKKEVDILVSTQIIFSWQDEIKSIALGAVAVISADTLLHLPDFHSGERTFQTIALLKNLSRLNEKFIIQTYNPENLVINAAAKGDWQSFYQEEIEARKMLNYPPFSQIVKLTFRHQDPKKSGQEAKILAAKLTNVIARSKAPKQPRDNTTPTGSPRPFGARDDIQISDALPAFIPREKGKFVWNIIIKFPIADSRSQIKMSSEFLRRRNSLLQYIPSNWNIDVDPESLL